MAHLVGVAVAHASGPQRAAPGALAEGEIPRPARTGAGVVEDGPALQLGVGALGLQGGAGGLQEADRAAAGGGLGGWCPENGGRLSQNRGCYGLLLGLLRSALLTES